MTAEMTAEQAFTEWWAGTDSTEALKTGDAEKFGRLAFLAGASHVLSSQPAMEPDTAARANRLAERMWREFVDDSKMDIRRVRDMCYIYLAQERDASNRELESLRAEIGLERIKTHDALSSQPAPKEQRTESSFGFGSFMDSFARIARLLEVHGVHNWEELDARLKQFVAQKAEARVRELESEALSSQPAANEQSAREWLLEKAPFAEVGANPECGLSHFTFEATCKFMDDYAKSVASQPKEQEK